MITIMIDEFCALGADPGPTTGMALLHYREGLLISAEVYQCNATAAPGLLGYLLTRTRGQRVLAQIERFVPGPRSAKLRGTRAGATTDVIDQLELVIRASLRPEISLARRSAADTKPWATDLRLKKAGLADLIPGMVHAADACRHAIFTACHDGGLPDPLSRRARPQLRQS
jgi:hypothetical protein